MRSLAHLQQPTDREWKDAARPHLSLAGLFLLLATAIGVCAILILRGESPAAFGALLAASLLVAILVRWQRGVYGLLLYLPVAGVVTLALLPWNGPMIFNPVGLKDWLFVIPAYLGFMGSIVVGRQALPRADKLTVTLLGAFAVLVLVEMVHPGIPNGMTALIGAKVWLTYIPLYFLGLALAVDRRNLANLWRLMMVIAVFPCLVGVGEYLASYVFGYDRVMAQIYGSHAADVTQAMTWFDVGGGEVFRIPSTFTFWTQYFSFTLAMLVPGFAVWRSDPSPAWRRTGGIFLGFVTLAGFLSGSRGAFVFLPLALVVIYWLERGLAGAVRAGAYVAVALAGALAISRVAAKPMFDWIWGLFSSYAVDTAYGGLAQALGSSWLGHGTGTNTGPARYAFGQPELFVAIQNYYAKTTYELGVLGLAILVCLFATWIVGGVRTLRTLRDPGLRATASALTGFVIIVALNSFKGWMLDLDPVNVYFWLFAGVLASLGRLDSPPPPLHEGLDAPAAEPAEAQA